jgi:hypothetical protein
VTLIDVTALGSFLDSTAFSQCIFRVHPAVMTKNIDHLNMDITLPSVPSVRLQNIMHGPDDDWSGTTDPAKRRKIQNRLHQRAWSMYIYGLLYSFKSWYFNLTLQEGGS